MKIVKPNAVLINKDLHLYQKIEMIGRTCYKSENMITEDSAAKFCKAMLNNRHLAMLEHAVIHVLMNEASYSVFMSGLKEHYQQSNCIAPFKYLSISQLEHYHVVTGSFRAFLELLEDLGIGHHEAGQELADTLNFKYPELFCGIANEYYYPSCGHTLDIISDDELISMCSDTNILKHHIYHSVKFTCDTGVSHELVRQRPVSFAQESTRYCNYSKGKFGNEITVIEPVFYMPDSPEYLLWQLGCEHDETVYFQLLDLGRTPQEARDNLPKSLKTDIVLTTYEYEWDHILDLRLRGTTGAPHPQMLEVMKIAHPLLVEESQHRCL